jgi:ketosteroid isomerase-like protein
MNKITALILFLISAGSMFGQDKEGQTVLEVNRQIDEGVVKKDIALLNKLYGDDFIFTHGTGHVDSKESWVKHVAKPETQFLSRVHDSTQVEMHHDIGIVTGKLSISRQDKDKIARYGIRYVRIYNKRKNNWQLISHRTVKEWHDE